MLLGQRTASNKVTITAALGLPHVVKPPNFLTMDFEDLENDKTLALLARSLAASVNPNEDEPTMVLGWYATSPELNTYTPLIHERFVNKLAASIQALPVTAFSSSSASAHASQLHAIHLTLDPKDLSFKTYVTAPVGLGGRTSNAIFVPVEHQLQISEAERPTRELPFLSLSSPLNFFQWTSFYPRRSPAKASRRKTP
jgi:translation initiation factor 3 subunit F